MTRNSAKIQICKQLYNFRGTTSLFATHMSLLWALSLNFGFVRIQQQFSRSCQMLYVAIYGFVFKGCCKTTVGVLEKENTPKYLGVRFARFFEMQKIRIFSIAAALNQFAFGKQNVFPIFAQFHAKIGTKSSQNGWGSSFFNYPESFSRPSSATSKLI